MIRKGSVSFKFIVYSVVAFLVVSLLLSDFLSIKGTEASILGLPEPTQLLSTTNHCKIPVLKGLRLDPENPLNISFILDSADSRKVSEEEISSMINYFLAGLTVPKEDIWVNLSPYEADRILPDSLNETEIGKDLLGQDYILKQLASSLTHPGTKLGESYWQNQNNENFNKVWITPANSEITEYKTSAIITEANLKVMTERDFLAEQANANGQSISRTPTDVLIKEISKEVNSGKHFAKLRQIYHSLILAEWFKTKFYNSFYKNYINQSKLSGIYTQNSKIRQKIWSLYTQSFQKGVYNIIKKGKINYISGGWSSSSLNPNISLMSSNVKFSRVLNKENFKEVSVKLIQKNQSSAIEHLSRDVGLERMKSVLYDESSFRGNDEIKNFKPFSYEDVVSKKGWYSIGKQIKKNLGPKFAGEKIKVLLEYDDTIAVFKISFFNMSNTKPVVYYVDSWNEKNKKFSITQTYGYSSKLKKVVFNILMNNRPYKQLHDFNRNPKFSYFDVLGNNGKLTIATKYGTYDVYTGGTPSNRIKVSLKHDVQRSIVYFEFKEVGKEPQRKYVEDWNSKGWYNLTDVYGYSSSRNELFVNSVYNKPNTHNNSTQELIKLPRFSYYDRVQVDGSYLLKYGYRKHKIHLGEVFSVKTGQESKIVKITSRYNAKRKLSYFEFKSEEGGLVLVRLGKYKFSTHRYDLSIFNFADYDAEQHQNDKSNPYIDDTFAILGYQYFDDYSSNGRNLAKFWVYLIKQKSEMELHDFNENKEFSFELSIRKDGIFQKRRRDTFVRVNLSKVIEGIYSQDRITVVGSLKHDDNNGVVYFEFRTKGAKKLRYDVGDWDAINNCYTLIREGTTKRRRDNKAFKADSKRPVIISTQNVERFLLGKDLLKVSELIVDEPTDLMQVLGVFSDLSVDEIKNIVKSYSKLNMRELARGGGGNKTSDRYFKFVQVILERLSIIESLSEEKQELFITILRRLAFVHLNTDADKLFQQFFDLLSKYSDSAFLKRAYESLILEKENCKRLHIEHVVSKLRPHQIPAIRLMRTRDKFLNLDEARLGKTLTTLAAIEPRWKSLIIVPASIMQTWKEEIDAHLNPASRARVVLLRGSVEEKKEMVDDLPDNNVMIIASIEDLLREPGYDFAKVTGNLDVVVVDEWQYVENYKGANAETNAIQAEAMQTISAKRKWLLTATPFNSKPEKMFSLFNYLYQNEENTPEAFRDVNVFKRTFTDDIDGFLSLHLELAKISIRRTKADVYKTYDKFLSYDEKRTSVPYVKDYNLFYEQTDKQSTLMMSLIKSYKGFLTENAENENVEAHQRKDPDEVSALDKIQALEWATLFPSKLGVNMDVTNNPAWQNLFHEVDRRIQQGKKGIVVAYNVEVIQQLEKSFKEKYGNNSTAIIYGDSNKDIERTKFQNDSKCKVLIMSVQSGTGINLTAAEWLIYLQQPRFFTQYYQSRQRPLGPDENNMRPSVEIINLIPRYSKQFKQRYIGTNLEPYVDAGTLMQIQQERIRAQEMWFKLSVVMDDAVAYNNLFQTTPSILREGGGTRQARIVQKVGGLAKFYNSANAKVKRRIAQYAATRRGQDIKGNSLEKVLNELQEDGIELVEQDWDMIAELRRFPNKYRLKQLLNELPHLIMYMYTHGSFLSELSKYFFENTPDYFIVTLLDFVIRNKGEMSDVEVMAKIINDIHGQNSNSRRKSYLRLSQAMLRLVKKNTQSLTIVKSIIDNNDIDIETKTQAIEYLSLLSGINAKLPVEFTSVNDLKIFLRNSLASYTKVNHVDLDDDKVFLWARFFAALNEGQGSDFKSIISDAIEVFINVLAENHSDARNLSDEHISYLSSDKDFWGKFTAEGVYETDVNGLNVEAVVTSDPHMILQSGMLSEFLLNCMNLDANPEQISALVNELGSKASMLTVLYHNEKPIGFAWNKIRKTKDGKPVVFIEIPLYLKKIRGEEISKSEIEEAFAAVMRAQIKNPSDDLMLGFVNDNVVDAEQIFSIGGYSRREYAEAIFQLRSPGRFNHIAKLEPFSESSSALNYGGVNFTGINSGVVNSDVDNKLDVLSEVDVDWSNFSGFTFKIESIKDIDSLRELVQSQ